MKRIGIWPIVAFVFFSAPLVLYAVPGFTNQNPVTLGANTCASSSCHSGTAAAGGSVVVTGFPPGMTYTPGTPMSLTVTVTDANQTRKGFELTARLASNTATAAGTWTAGTNSNTGTNGVPVIQGLANSPTFSFVWTPPATAAGSVNFYLTGLAGGCCSGDGLYTNMYTLTPAAAATPDFSLSASPTSLTVTQGSSGSSTITVTPQNGFNSTVAMSASGLPSGVTSSFSSAGVMTLSASGTATTGTSTVTITGTSTSLSHTTTVSLTVNAAAATTLTANPSSLSFTAQQGGAAPASKTISVGSSLAGLMYTTATSGGSTWLTATPATGNAPGTVTVAVNPASLTAGSYAGIVTITASSGSPQATVNVALTVTTASSAGLTATPASLSFSYQTGGRVPTPRTVTIASTSGSTSFTTSESDPWLSISPTSGRTPGSIRVSVNPAGMATGSYTAQINVSAPNGKTVTIPATLMITSGGGCGDDDCGGGGTPSGMYAQANVHDPNQSGALVASWVDNLGTSPHNTTDPRNQGLVLSKSASAPTDGYAGAIIQNTTGISLTELGFDFRAGIQCSADSPHFVVVATDGVTHTLGGCGSGPGTTQSSTTMGWIRLRFDPTKAVPAINPRDQVQSISIVLDKGPTQGANAAGTIVVIDNIDVNGVIVQKR